MADEVPPLEDVPEILNKIEKKEVSQKRTKVVSKDTSDPNHKNKEIIPDKEKLRNENRSTLDPKPVLKTDKGERLLEAEVLEKKSRVDGKKMQQRASTGFGEMTKGFLFGGVTKPKEMGEKEMEDLPLIRAQPKMSSLVLKEVQEAMDANHAMEFQDKLAKRLESNRKVADVIADPAWIPILDELKHDPQAVLTKYKHDPVITSTLRELCNVLGDTFLEIGHGGHDSDGVSVSKYAEAPGVTEALQDPLVKTIMDHMRAGESGHVQRCVQSANPCQRKKIQNLIDVGLFKFNM